MQTKCNGDSIEFNHHSRCDVTRTFDGGRQYHKHWLVWLWL